MEQKIKDNFIVSIRACVRKFNPIELASSDKKKVTLIFVTLNGKVKGDVQGTGYRLLYYLYDDRFGCTRCRVQVWRVYRNVSGRV